MTKKKARKKKAARPGSRPDLRTEEKPMEQPRQVDILIPLDADQDISDTVAQLKKRAFLEAFRILGTVYHAAQQAQVGRRTVQRWKKQDPEFRALFNEAAEDATDIIEGQARVRANAGVKRNVLYKGKVVDSYFEYSDTLSIVLLKAYRPEKFREKYELSGPGGGPLEITNPIQRIQAKLDEIARRSAGLLPQGKPAPVDGKVDGDLVGATTAGNKGGNPRRSRKG